MSDSQSWALVSVRVKSTEATRCTAFVRSHPFVVGKPLTFDREDPEVSAMEYLAAAVAADIVGTFRKVARERRVALDEIEAVAQGDVHHALSFLGVVGEEGEPALRSMTIKVYAGSGAPAVEVDAAWEAALARSPLYSTLRHSIELTATLQISY